MRHQSLHHRYALRGMHCSILCKLCHSCKQLVTQDAMLCDLGLRRRAQHLCSHGNTDISHLWGLLPYGIHVNQVDIYPVTLCTNTSCSGVAWALMLKPNNIPQTTIMQSSVTVLPLTQWRTRQPSSWKPPNVISLDYASSQSKWH